MKNLNSFEGEVPSESVGKARSYGSERHCERKKSRERRLHECNSNCNHFQNVEGSDDDDIESGYFEFQNNQERPEILNNFLKNDMISSETKISCANKLYEVTKKTELEEGEDTLSPKESNGKDSFPENNKEGQNNNKITKTFNTNVNSFSEKNHKSRKNLKTSTSKREKSLRPVLGFNNNAESISPSKEVKEFEAELEQLQQETWGELKEITKQMQNTEVIYEKLDEERTSVAQRALQKAELILSDTPTKVKTFATKVVNMLKKEKYIEDKAKLLDSKSPSPEKFRLIEDFRPLNVQFYEMMEAEQKGILDKAERGKPYVTEADIGSPIGDFETFEEFVANQETS